ncbi:MAG: hypothetical protein LBT46_08235 [Planctomycetaceae bacterium]|jgi:hypothetical protein|nr:hypothetical protein [Planctomycetaceae bacterium]
MKLLITITLLFFATIISGCGSGVRVSGKVTFDDDSPMALGTIMFDSGLQVYSGAMRSDGTYSLGVTQDRQRIPAGKYKVWFSATARIERLYGKDGKPVEPPRQLVFSQIQEDYTGFDRTSLEADVQTGNRTFDFVVKRHPDWDKRQKYGPNGSESGK